VAVPMGDFDPAKHLLRATVSPRTALARSSLGCGTALSVVAYLLLVRKCQGREA
jgi:hypothetical protein